MSASSPVAARSPSVRARLLWSVVALLPGAAAQVWAGDSTLPVRLSLALMTAIGIEALALRLRAQPLSPFLKDGSAVLIAWLLALWLSPGSPWWIAPLGAGIAVGLFKQVFGGLGREILHPAMGAYAVLVVLLPPSLPAADAGLASPWVIAGYVLGGLALLTARVVRWEASVAVLATVLTLLLMATWADPARNQSWIAAAPWCLAAFFLVTDPLTSCRSPRGRWVFGIGVALLGLGLQARGATPPAAIAFALLLMNAAAPWIDRHTEPRAWTRPA